MALRLDSDYVCSFEEVTFNGPLKPVPFEKIFMYSKELHRGYSQYVRLQPVLPIALVPIFPLVIRLRRRVCIWRLKRILHGAKVIERKLQNAQK